MFTSSVKDIPGCLKMYLSEDISVFTEGKENEEIMAAHYKKTDSDIYFLINVSGQGYDTQVRIKYKGKNQPNLKIIPLGTDEKSEKLDFKMENGYLNATLYFHSFQSYALMLDNTAISCDISTYGTRRKYCLDIKGEWGVCASSMNALRLYHWDLDISNFENSEFEFSASSKERVTSKPIIDQVVDGRIALPMHVENYFGCPKDILFPQLQCKYSTYFNVDTLIPLWMVIEPGSIEGEWYMQLNGKMLKLGDFINKEIYLPTNLAADITSMLKQGKNSLEVFVKTTNTYDGVVNPLYIFGNFGLAKSDTSAEYWHIESMPGKGEIVEMAECGLPFYAGEVEYSKQLVISDDFTGELELYIDDPKVQGSVQLDINGHNAGVKSWSPYCWRVDKSWLNPKG